MSSISNKEACENAQWIMENIKKLREAWDEFETLEASELVNNIFKSGWLRCLLDNKPIKELAITLAGEGNLTSTSIECSDCPSNVACIELRAMYREIPIRLIARDSIITGIQHVAFILNMEDSERPELKEGDHDLEHQEAMKRMGHTKN